MLALSIMGLLPENIRQQDGVALLCGELLTGFRQRRRLLGDRMVYIPQNGLEALNPSRKISAQLADGLQKLGIPRRQQQRRITENLQTAGFHAPEEIMNLYPFQLSGGMAQRVTIALAAGSRASLVIADEPTNGLDSDGKAHFIQLLDRVFPQAGKLIITHDLSVAALCSRTCVLCGGLPMEMGPDLTVSPRHPYTMALLNALVAKGMQETPVLRAGSSPCPFYCRCPQAQASCLHEIPRRSQGSREWWCCL